MNLNDLPESLSSAQRLDLALAIQRAITRLNPDHDEAIEIHDALIASLKHRYPPEQIWDVIHYGDYFSRALERLPFLAMPEVDECAAYKDFRAAHDD